MPHRGEGPNAITFLPQPTLLTSFGCVALLLFVPLSIANVLVLFFFVLFFSSFFFHFFSVGETGTKESGKAVTCRPYSKHPERRDRG
jgi:hypothetical protein